MVLASDWEDFSRQSQNLFNASGGNVRILVKYRHKEGKLVVKVTDGPKTLTCKTGDKEDIKYIERLQQWFLTESVDPAKAPGSAEYAAAKSVAGGTGAVSIASTRGAGAAPRTKHTGGASTGVSSASTANRISGAQKRKDRRKAIAEGRATLSAAQTARALKKTAQRARKRERRGERRMLAAAGAGPALAGMVPANPSR